MIAAAEDLNFPLEATDQDQDLVQGRGMVCDSTMVRDQVSLRVLAQWAERLLECQET